MDHFLDPDYTETIYLMMILFTILILIPFPFLYGDLI